MANKLMIKISNLLPTWRFLKGTNFFFWNFNAENLFAIKEIVSGNRLIDLFVT